MQYLNEFLASTNWIVWVLMAIAILSPYVTLYVFLNKYKKAVEERDEARHILTKTRSERRKFTNLVRNRVRKDRTKKRT